jgi:hypothetical protein
MNELRQRQIIAKGVSESNRYSGGDDGDGGALAMIVLFFIGFLIYSGLK